MRLIVVKIFILLSLFSCNSKIDNQDYSEEHDILIDSLLNQSNDYTKSKEERYELANKTRNALLTYSNSPKGREYFFKLAGRYYNIEKYEDYHDISKDVYKMSIKKNDSSGIARGLSYIGDYFYEKFITDSAYYYYSKSEKIYEQINDSEGENTVKFAKARILFFEKDFAGSETVVVDILKRAIKNKNYRLTYECYLTLGNILDGVGNFSESSKYYNKAFKTTDLLKEEPQYQLLRAQIYNYLGILYTKKGEYETAIEYLKDALSFSDFKLSEPILYSNLLNNLGYAMVKSSNLKSKEFLYKSFKIRDSLGYGPGIVTSKISISEYDLLKKDTISAIDNCVNSAKLAHSIKLFDDELKALNILSKIDKKNKVLHMERYVNLTDSLHNQERVTRNKFARIEFETDEIITEKNVIQEEKDEISKQRWTILGLSLIALIFVFMIYTNRIQRAKNRELLLEQQQQKANEEIYQLMLDQHSKIDEGRQAEKKRIAQELHDGIMSKLTSTRLNLFVLSKRNDEETIKKCITHIDGIQEIEKEIRAISHDLNRDIFAAKDSFKAIIESLFENQKNISEANYSIEIDDKISWESIDSPTKMHLYRIFQESLQNIYKYAKAKNVSASIKKLDSHIFIQIKDDGQGFDVKKAKEGIGLKNMNARISAINGEISFESEKGKGTTIKINIPA
ncbi:Signal transduction histidine kinase [Flavobacterium terrae]|uniref:Oxygen sensor histidine kinase NreB n=1 Tax=Flavobacterium terrae TaxID=415425 RepID=A0A1M6B2E6_9FLAO|nr:Signal transduction histidine kinase [Flavobacterium terrae]